MKLFIATAAALLLSACSAYEHVAPLHTTYLEDVDITKRIKNMPFQHSWVWAKNIDRSKYSSLYIPPIRVDLLPADACLESKSAFLPTDESYRNKVQEVANYFHESLVNKLKSSPGNKLAIADQRGPNTAVIEIALTEVVFSRPAARVAVLASPLPGSDAMLSAITQPRAAFAMRLSDGGDGTLLATAADRKFPPLRILDVNEMTISSSVREIIGFWVDELTEAIEKGRLAEVKSEGFFAILPW